MSENCLLKKLLNLFFKKMISFAIIGRSVQRNLLRSANMVAMIDHDCHHSILCLESSNFLHSSSRQLHSESSKKRQNLLLTKRRFSNHVHYNQIQLEPCPNSFQVINIITMITYTFINHFLCIL